MATTINTTAGRSKSSQSNEDGFSLVELVVAVAIISILGAVALPQYFSQIQKSRQSEAATTLSQIQTTIAAFVDEMGLLPVSWNDLDKITPLMTPEGPANQANFAWIDLASASCTESNREHCYEVNASEQDQIFTLTARSNHQDASLYNIVACLDLRTGSSDLKKGSTSGAASTADLRCVRNES
jgi:prepilin-type N-terminal cleavage/methylation domain-containing protein